MAINQRYLRYEVVSLEIIYLLYSNDWTNSDIYI